MTSLRRSGSPTTVVQRKRTGAIQVRKTVHFHQATIDRLERYAFDQRRALWEVIDAAVVEYLDRNAPAPSRRKTAAPPSAPSKRSHSTIPSPPSTKRATAPKSKKM